MLQVILVQVDKLYALFVRLVIIVQTIQLHQRLVNLVFIVILELKFVKFVLQDHTVLNTNYQGDVQQVNLVMKVQVFVKFVQQDSIAMIIVQSQLFVQQVLTVLSDKVNAKIVYLDIIA